MGCHPKALEAKYSQLRDATTGPGSLWYADEAEQRAAVDKLLDRLFDVTHRATEWDAERWGFDPDRWCEAERVEMKRRVRG